jgi:hypothetical protein
MSLDDLMEIICSLVGIECVVIVCTVKQLPWNGKNYVRAFTILMLAKYDKCD